MGSTDLELYAVQTGTLGVVVTDGEGRVLYGSDADQTNPPQSHCTDACAQTWLPLTVPAGQEPQLLGVDEAAVGRLARPDGSSQLTLGGWPVYVNRSDDGQLKQAGPDLQSQGWFAMSPAGDEGRAARLTVRGSSPCPKGPVGDGGLPRTATARHITRSAVFRSGDDQDGSRRQWSCHPPHRLRRVSLPQSSRPTTASARSSARGRPDMWCGGLTVAGARLRPITP